MTFDQMLIIAVLLLTMAVFIRGHRRHDLVAMGALLACVVFGLVPSEEAFSGFGHPAVITVACVLVLGHGLQITGAVDEMTRRVLPASAGPTVSLLALCAMAAGLSGVMNNVGAMALLMPVAIQMAEKQKLPPGKVLMPLAFCSILGGMTTMIGTPPNLIVAGFRAEAGPGGFGLFDYTPVGLSVAVVGILFIALAGRRLVPVRQQSDLDRFDMGKYLSEIRVDEDSKVIGKRLRDVENMLEGADAQIVGLVRYDLRVSAPNPWHLLREGDILTIEADPDALTSALSELNLKLEEDVSPEEGEEEEGRDKSAERSGIEGKHKKEEKEKEKEKSSSEEIFIQEMVVRPGAQLIGRTASDIELRSRYGINLLAISRQGRRSIKRLRSTVIQPGDVLLMRGMPQALAGFGNTYGCLPLATRDIRVPKKGQSILAACIMATAILATALGILPVAISFAGAVLAFILLHIVPLRSLYSAIDWSVIVLLGAMLPVAHAMDSTGTADLIASFFIDNVAQGNAIIGLTVILIVTMVLTDFMNNAATAALMCPLALSTAAQLQVNSDSFLMAVAVGASCAFLTPIGHQNNTLILGPGGFRFGDYWPLGLPTEVLVVLVSVPMLLWVWPL